MKRLTLSVHEGEIPTPYYGQGESFGHAVQALLAGLIKSKSPQLNDSGLYFLISRLSGLPDKHPPMRVANGGDTELELKIECF